LDGSPVDSKPASSIYVLDSDALINLKSHSFTRKLGKHLHRIRIPEGVYREIKRRVDRLRKSLEQWIKKEPSLVITFDRHSSLRDTLVQMERKYGRQFTVKGRVYKGFWQSRGGRKSADAQVVAAGRVFGYVVVTNDKTIQAACMLENVRHIVWTEFVLRLNLLHQKRLIPQ